MPEGVGEVSSSSYDILKSGVEIILKNGFSFAESTVGMIMQLSDSELQKAAETIQLEVCNSFIPPTLPIVKGGAPLKDYVKEAMRRMEMLGIGIVIFGSGAARRIPDGMAMSDGMKHLEDFLHMCNEYGKKHNVVVAVEPLNSRETNAITSLEQGLTLVDKLQLPQIKLLADCFHMDREQEDLSILDQAARVLVHVHVSGPDRAYPGKKSNPYLLAFLDKLKEIDYKGRVAVECSFDDFDSESAASAVYLKESLK